MSITVQDVGEIEGRQYLVAEFVEGGTLREWSIAGTRTWRQIVDLLAMTPTSSSRAFFMDGATRRRRGRNRTEGRTEPPQAGWDESLRG